MDEWIEIRMHTYIYTYYIKLYIGAIYGI